MSQIVDQRLFELVQLAGVSGSMTGESRRRLSLRTSARFSPAAAATRTQGRQIVSFTASPCGRLVVFAAASLAETCEAPSPDSADTRPFLASVLLSKSEEPGPTAATVNSNCDSSSELVNFEVQWLPWFQDPKLRPTCLTLSPDSDFCLIGCENGSLFIVSIKTLCPGFEPRTDRDLSHKDWSAKRTHKVYPVDHCPETSGEQQCYSGSAFAAVLLQQCYCSSTIVTVLL